MKEYLDLYEAIWVQAINDDLNEVINILFNIGSSEIKNCITDKEEKIKLEEDLKKYCKEKAKRIEIRIKELIYKEATDYPKNEYYKIKDEKYNIILKRLKFETVEHTKRRLKDYQSVEIEK